MNEIEFVIARDEFGPGPADGVEPVIDGVSLVELLAEADGQLAYAGLVPPEMFLERWRKTFALGEPARLHLLGCGCGDDWCSHALAELSFSDDEVTLSDFWGSHRRGAYESLGPFRFDRDRFEQALANPVRAERPVRRAG